MAKAPCVPWALSRRLRGRGYTRRAAAGNAGPTVREEDDAMPTRRLAAALSLALAVSAGDAGATTRAPNPPLAGIPPGTALDLGRLECENLKGMRPCQSITDYSGFVYDRHGHRMVMFGGGHAASFSDAIWALDLDAEKPSWKPLYESTPCAEMTEQNFDAATGSWRSTGHPFSRHTYDLLVVPDDRNELVLFDGDHGIDGDCVRWVPANLPSVGKVAVYDFAARRWELTEVPGKGYPFAAEFDPVSKQTLFVGRGGVIRFDHATRAYTRLAPAFGSNGYANHLVYFPPNDRFYYFDRGEPTRVWEVALERPRLASARVTEVPAANAPASRETGYAYDPGHRVIGGNVRGSAFHTFDPIARSWASHPIEIPGKPDADVGTLTYPAIDFDPVNGVFVLIADGRGGRRTWAYRLPAP